MQEDLTLTLRDVKVKHIKDDIFRLEFITSDRTNKAIFHHVEGNTAAVVLVGGVGGGFDGPASIYKDMPDELVQHGISSVRLDYRYRNDLQEAVVDVLLAIEFLRTLGIERVGLVGWSFGGAVVIEAGVASDLVNSVVTIASQTYGTGAVDELSPKALLILHGTNDTTLPPACSEDIYTRAGEPKELILYEGGNHGIDQKRDEMLKKVNEFLIEHLSEE